MLFQFDRTGSEDVRLTSKLPVFPFGVLPRESP
jgi:hypothetical protein